MRALWPTLRAAVARRLHRMRRRAGLSQEQVAERSGLHAKTVQRLERGTENPSVRTLLAYTVACDGALKELFAPDEPGAPPPVRDASARAVPVSAGVVRGPGGCRPRSGPYSAARSHGSSTR